MKKILLQQEPIDLNKIMEESGTDADGAVVCFVGRPRNKSGDGKEVAYLEYESYNGMAVKELEKIADSAIGKWSLGTCIIIHRYGRVNISEPSIVIAVSSPHRNESYQASRYIIDTVKKTIPIWKKEVYTDGSHWATEGG